MLFLKKTSTVGGLNRQCRRVSSVHPPSLLPASPMPQQPKRRKHKGSQADAVTVCEDYSPSQIIENDPGSRTFHHQQQRAFSSIYGVLWDFWKCNCPLSPEGALQQAVAATPSGTYLLGPKPFHHVACVATMPTGQAEVG